MSLAHILRTRSKWLALAAVYIVLAIYVYNHVYSEKRVEAAITTQQQNFKVNGLIHGSQQQTSSAGGRDSPSPDNGLNVEDMPRNGTLGFGEIMYISMLDRSDRQDAMNLLASYTGLSLTYIPGVPGESISSKALPVGNERVKPGAIGCWRAHADAWRRLLGSTLETALILEDDIDWDVNVKDIMSTLSKTIRGNNTLRLEPPTEHEETSAPYGLDWDVLWIGACIHNVDPQGSYILYDDPHAPAKKDTRDRDHQYFQRFFNETYPEKGGKRILSHAGRPVCTMGYAITRKGAQKLLFHIGYNGLYAPVDLTMGWLHHKGRLFGYEVHPQVVTEWHIGGAKDSDIDTHEENTTKQVDKASLGLNMRNSARKAMEKEWNSLNYWENLLKKKNQDSHIE